MVVVTEAETVEAMVEATAGGPAVELATEEARVGEAMVVERVAVGKGVDKEWVGKAAAEKEAAREAGRVEVARVVAKEAAKEAARARVAAKVVVERVEARAVGWEEGMVAAPGVGSWVALGRTC